uniref:C2H2-type domain-containing protein n=1 Tax=Strongyloides stercoralis TaxID=6248 RepID=A0A0K0EN26_STRER
MNELEGENIIHHTYENCFSYLDIMYKCYACEEMFIDPMLRSVHASTHPDNLIAGIDIHSISIDDNQQTDQQEYGLRCFEDGNGLGDNNNNREEDEWSKDCEDGKNNNEKVFVCSVCDKQFGCSSSLQRHNRLHKGSLCYKCVICSKTFTRTDTFNIHGMKHIQGYAGLECPLPNCTLKLDGVDAVSEHIKTSHNDNIFNCKECGKGFTRSENLMIHYYNFHGPLKINRTLCKV